MKFNTLFYWAVISIFGTLNLFGNVVEQWDCDVNKVSSHSVSAYHGEDISLECKMHRNGKLYNPYPYYATFMWQTNGMKDAWWQTNATISAGVVKQNFTTYMDPGADKTTFFFHILDKQGASYRVNGSISFQNSPAGPTGSLPLPVKVLDFSFVDVKNPDKSPFALKEQLDEKQDVLISGTNIKTINNETLLGPGDISISHDTNSTMNIVKAMKPKKLGNYLWEVGTEGEDWTAATNRLAKVYPSYGKCTGVATKNMHGRNLDWEYDRGCSILVRSPHREGKYAVIGVADGVKSLTDDLMMSEKWDDAYLSLPFCLCDGMNECGVVIQQNIIQTNLEKSATWHTKRQGCIICFAMIRYALDRCSTALDAATMIRDLIFVPTEFPYDFHYLVSDRSSAYVVEDGTIYPADTMTNFRIGGMQTNSNGTVKWDTIEPYGMGVERYNLIKTSGYDANTWSGMANILYDVRYTRTYDTTTSPYWYTEFCEQGTDLTVMNALTNNAAFYTVKTNECHIYQEEHNVNSPLYRGGFTWQTAHAAIYDKTSLALTLYTQEDFNTPRNFYLIEDKRTSYLPAENAYTNNTYYVTNNIVVSKNSSIYFGNYLTDSHITYDMAGSELVLAGEKIQIEDLTGTNVSELIPDNSSIATSNMVERIVAQKGQTVSPQQATNISYNVTTNIIQKDRVRVGSLIVGNDSSAHIRIGGDDVAPNGVIITSYGDFESTSWFNFLCRSTSPNKSSALYPDDSDVATSNMVNGIVKTATNAVYIASTNDAANKYLPLTGGTITGGELWLKDYGGGDTKSYIGYGNGEGLFFITPPATSHARNLIHFSNNGAGSGANWSILTPDKTPVLTAELATNLFPIVTNAYTTKQSDERYLRVNGESTMTGDIKFSSGCSIGSTDDEGGFVNVSAKHFTVSTNPSDRSDLIPDGTHIATSNMVNGIVKAATNGLVVAPHAYEGLTGKAADSGAYAEAWATNVTSIIGTKTTYADWVFVFAYTNSDINASVIRVEDYNRVNGCTIVGSSGNGSFIDSSTFVGQTVNVSVDLHSDYEQVNISCDGGTFNIRNGIGGIAESYPGSSSHPCTPTFSAWTVATTNYVNSVASRAYADKDGNEIGATIVAATNATLAAAKADASAKYLPLTGGTMTGNLYIIDDSSLYVGADLTVQEDLDVGSDLDVGIDLDVGRNLYVVNNFAQGQECVVRGSYCHAEGFGTTASSESSHAEGDHSTASGAYSHAEGFFATASNDYSYAWSGFFDDYSYGSHGTGTFNINPLGGLAGFYIGETNFVGHVTNVVVDTFPIVTNTYTKAEIDDLPQKNILHMSWDGTSNPTISETITAISEALTNALPTFIYVNGVYWLHMDSWLITAYYPEGSEGPKYTQYVGYFSGLSSGAYYVINSTVTVVPALGIKYGYAVQQQYASPLYAQNCVKSSALTNQGAVVQAAYDASTKYLGKTETATDSDKLGGKAASEYLTTDALNGYDLVDLSGTSVTLASGQIGNVTVSSTALTVALDFSAASNRSGDCMLYVINSGSSTCSVTITPSTLDIVSNVDKPLTLTSGSKNVIMFSKLKSNLVLVSKQEVN